MASFKPTIITKKGHALMAKIVAGKATPKFTKISVSDHEYSSSTNFESVTNLSSIKQTTLVSSVSKINSAAVKVSGALSNAELSTGYYLRTIGLYATDPSEGEILYSITTATKPDWIPPNNGVSASSIMIDLITVVSNASNVSIDVDPNATATVAQINELKDEMDKNKTVPFWTEGKSVTSYPMGTKGLFNPEVKGVKPIYQSVENGDFSDGTTGWNPSYSTINSSGKILNVTGDGSSSHARVYKHIPFQPDSRYFIYVRLQVINTHATFLEGFTSGAQTLRIPSIQNPAMNKWYELKGFVNTGSGVTSGNFMMLATYADAQTANGKILQIDGRTGLFAINMTQNGIEDYTEEQMLEIVRGGYWEGLKIPSQNYDLVSRGKNLFDVSKFIDVFDKYKTYYKINDNRTGIYATTIHDTRSWSGMPLYDGLNANTYTITADNPSNGTLAIYDEFTNSVLNTRDTNINKSFTLPTGKFKLKYLADKNSELSNIQIERGTIPTPYEPYISTKTGVSMPRPLIKIDDIEDEILDNGDIVYNNTAIITLDSSTINIDDIYDINKQKNNTRVRFKGSLFSNKEPRGYWEIGDHGKPHFDNRLMAFYKENRIRTAGYSIFAEGNEMLAGFEEPSKFFVIGFQNSETGWSSQPSKQDVIDFLDANPIMLYYQLAKPEIVHDGEQGYQAPSTLPAYQNGDLVLLPKHHTKYQANATTTITLDEEICDLDYTRTEIDGKIVDLDCTLESDGKTVTIPETTGWVDIKGTIPSKNCLNPEICADMPANLGTITSANTTSIANLQQKYDTHENIQDLINLEMDYRLTILENR